MCIVEVNMVMPLLREGVTQVMLVVPLHKARKPSYLLLDHGGKGRCREAV